MKQRKKFWNMRRKENYAGFIFLIPWFIGFLLFLLYPLIYSLRLAFSGIVDMMTFQLRFVGLDNFREAILTDVSLASYLVSSLQGTLVNTPVVLVFSMFVAVLLNRNIKGRAFFRASFLIPVLIGTGTVMRALPGNSGQVDFAGGVAMAQSAVADTGFSFQDVGTLDDKLLILLGPSFASILQGVLNTLTNIMWVSGIQIIIFLGSLQTIPQSLYEAAFCDGASEWDKFWNITLPLLTPTILLNAIYTMIDYFTNIDNKVIEYVTQISFGGTFRLAYGSAISWLYFLIIGTVLLLVALLMRKREFYMG